MEWLILAPSGVALAVSLGLALAARLRGAALLGTLAAGAGLLAGWWWMFGVITASPRQLPERLPLLALAMLAWAALAEGLASWRLPPLVLACLGAVATGWWMAGAPRTAADLATAAPVLAGVGIAALLALRGRGWQAVAAAAALCAGLLSTPAPGPGPVLGLVLLAAMLGAALGGSLGGVAAALPVAAGLAALGALPVLAQGRPADWAIAAAPLAALWFGPPIAARLPGRIAPVAGAVLAALPCVFAAWVLQGRL